MNTAAAEWAARVADWNAVETAKARSLELSASSLEPVHHLKAKSSKLKATSSKEVAA